MTDSDDDATPAPPESVAAPGVARVGVPWWIVAVLTLLLGLAGGVLIGRATADEASVVSERRSDSVDCERVRAVVQRAVDEMTSIGEEVTVQDATFFAAMLVEQRSVTYAMELGPDCFSLEDRAAATGLLAGLEGLLSAADTSSNPIDVADIEPVEPDEE